MAARTAGIDIGMRKLRHCQPMFLPPAALRLLWNRFGWESRWSVSAQAVGLADASRHLKRSFVAIFHGRYTPTPANHIVSIRAPSSSPTDRAIVSITNWIYRRTSGEPAGYTRATPNWTDLISAPRSRSMMLAGARRRFIGQPDAVRPSTALNASSRAA